MLHAMEARLYVVHGSHPCACVEKALQLKGIDYRRIEFPPPLHAPLQRLRFGARTVPGLKLDGERVAGSRAILRRLEELRPQPPLYPADAEARARVEEAERWGDEVLQSAARRLSWQVIKRRPRVMASYARGSRYAMPAPVATVAARAMVPVEVRLNQATDDALLADLAALPGHIDRVDGWIAEGLLGGEQPNAADLQIAPSIRLLMTIGDVRPLIEAHPAEQLALRLFPDWAGDAPAGILPQPVAA
jgi:glutathione S-transferase